MPFCPFETERRVNTRGHAPIFCCFRSMYTYICVIYTYAPREVISFELHERERWRWYIEKPHIGCFYHVSYSSSRVGFGFSFFLLFFLVFLYRLQFADSCVLCILHRTLWDWTLIILKLNYYYCLKRTNDISHLKRYTYSLFQISSRSSSSCFPWRDLIGHRTKDSEKSRGKARKERA